MHSRTTSILIASTALCLATSTAFGQIADYAEDFEAYDQASPSAMADGGWLVFANVFNSGGGYLYGYGPFPAPNGGPGFCAVAAGEGGVDQGAQQIVVYSDYNNGDHAGGNLIEANVFQEQVVDASDVGKTFTFQWDAKMGDLVPDSTALGFIKIIDSVTFGLDGYETADMTAISSTWGTHSLSITIDASHVGDYFQVGFSNTATLYTASGVVYDNISLTGDSGGSLGLAPYVEDFEAYDQASPSAMTDGGWLVFANVFNSGGGYLYGYGPFPAPNGGPGFCAVAAGEGGAGQGAQQIVVYSDYNNGDHAGGNLIEANVFQEQVVDASDVGKTFTFQWDAKMGDLIPDSTALGFIKIIDGVNFGLDGYAAADMTAVSSTWGTYSLSITIDAAHVGDYFQIGFSNTATLYTPSGVLYDNINFGEETDLGTNYCGSTANSTGFSSRISATGDASIGAADLTLSADNIPTAQFGIFYFGPAQLADPFGNGIRCVGSGGTPTWRLPIALEAGGTLTHTVNFTVNASRLAAAQLDGGMVNFQCWFRDPAAGSSNFDLSDGYSIVMTP